jgi:hypothetical protein
MDLNEYLKQLIFQYQPKVQEGLNMASQAGQQGLGLIADDASTLAKYMADPRMAGIGLGPEAAVMGKGLGLMAGALRGIGGSRESLNPFLVQAWKRGEELSQMHAKVREAPSAFGFETPSAWRKSLPKEDLWSLWMYENTAKDVASAELKRQGMLESGTFPSETAMDTLAAREQFPPGHQYSEYAVGINPLTNARRRANE